MSILAATAVTALAASGLQAQANGRYQVEPATSLAWWQIDPHHGHLWGTTCPADPSWQPGEGRTGNTNINYKTRPRNISEAGRHDNRIPLFPRDDVNAVCGTAVRGEINVTDARAWTISGGTIEVTADQVNTGLDLRDRFAHKAVLETARFPHIRFVIERLEKGTQVGDTIRGTAIGTLELHGVKQPMRAPVVAWPVAGGLRVQAQMQCNAEDLTDVYGMSKLALGMGVGLGRWKTIHFGVDVVLKPSAG